jgi:acetylornithine deacetylase
MPASGPKREATRAAEPSRRSEEPVPASSAAVHDLLKTLVAFDTTSAKSNLKLIAFVRDYLGGCGIASTSTSSEDGAKASLFATIGPGGKGGIGLSGHSDCVPVEGQAWSSDPFTLTERDGKLYGRGACDMKGFLACVLASVPLFVSSRLKEPVHIMVSYDEEVGCTGVRPLIARLGKDLPRPRAIIVGEPTNMAVIEAHKRVDAYRTVVTGREAHSSLPQLGVNAISVAAELVEEIDRIDVALAAETNERFEPPFSTVQVGTIEGGTATNIVPKTCRFQWQVRGLPEADPNFAPQRLKTFADERLLPRMRRVAPAAAIETLRQGSVPAFLAKPGSEAVSLALALTGANSASTVSYGTEAGLFEEAGCPTVICGPGDIAQAHAADEFVAAAQLDACMAFLAKLAERLS